MTTSHILNAVSPLIADLAQDLSERERLRRLLAALRNLLPADAVAGPDPSEWGSTDTSKTAHWSQGY
jgi:hypothetical protein